MSEQDKDQKTEEATEKQKDRFREKGDVFRSQDVASVTSIAAGVGAIVFAWGLIGGSIASLTRAVLGQLQMNQNIYYFSFKAIEVTIKIMMPVALTGLLVGIAAQIAQVGFNFTLKPMEFKPEKFNPLPRIKTMFFSSDTLIEIAKSVVKVAVIGTIAFVVLFKEVENNGRLLALSAVEILIAIGNMGLKIILSVIIALAGITVLDVLIERWRHAKKMRMTKEEVKREHKDTDGDPLMKGRIRGKQQEMARARMVGNVENADVVVVNPTHYSVALKYDVAKNSAPIIVAAGLDKMAAKIREKARHSSIPIVSDPPLARALYNQGKIGKPIPQELFAAVASLLAWVYRVTKKM